MQDRVIHGLGPDLHLDESRFLTHRKQLICHHVGAGGCLDAVDDPLFNQLSGLCEITLEQQGIDSGERAPVKCDESFPVMGALASRNESPDEIGDIFRKDRL
jgi:hypothetical protein